MKDSQKNDAIFLACSKKEVRILEILLKKIPDFQTKNYVNLLTLAIQKSKEIKLNTSFFCFFCEESTEIVNILINFGVEIREKHLNLALELNLSQIWLFLKNKFDEKLIDKITDFSNESEFFVIRNENEVLKRKTQDFEVIFLINSLKFLM